MQKKNKIFPYFIFFVLVIVLAFVFIYINNSDDNLLQSPKLTIYQKSQEQNVVLMKNSFFPYEEILSVDYLKNLELQKEGYNKQEFNGYVIVLKERPISKIYSENKNSPDLQILIVMQKNKIDIEHNNVKNRIAQLRSDIEVKREFTKVLNALAVDDLTTEEIEILKSEGYEIFPNFKVHATLMDSVPLINADDVWKINSQGKPCPIKNILPVGGQPGPQSDGECITGKGVTIGIIDTGVDYTHSDLGGCLGENCKVIGGYDFVDGDNDPIDRMGHGTHVAAIAAGNGVLKGVAPDASIVAYRVLDQHGYGYDSDVIAAIETSVDPNNDGDFSDHLGIISLSLGLGCFWGHYSEDCGPDDVMSKSIDAAVEIGVVATIAAGNDYHAYNWIDKGEGSINSPGTSRKAITVGASRKDDWMADFSSAGPVLGKSFGIVKPDVVAPGEFICAAQHENWLNRYSCLDEDHISISGTSMATPHVAGVAALLKQKNPQWTPLDIKMALRNGAVDIQPYQDPIFIKGYGRIDALASSLLKLQPHAEIETGGTVSDIVNIIGEAQSSNFKQYILYLVSGPLHEQEDWSEIFRSNNPTEDILFAFDTRNIKDGLYTLRLQVEDIQGQISQDASVIKIENVIISNPTDTEEIRNAIGTYEIHGTADAGDFGSYRLKAIKGEYVSNQGFVFSAEPILIKESTIPVKDSVLGVWDVSIISEDSYYKILLEVVDSSGNIWDTDSRVAYIENEAGLHEGWPISTNGGLTTSSSFNALNIDGSEDSELFIAYPTRNSYVRKLQGLKHDARRLNGWPVTGEHLTVLGSPAIGDLDNDGRKEIVLQSKHWLDVFNDDGSLRFTYEAQGANFGDSGGWFSTAVLADLDNDNDLEIIYSDHWPDGQSSKSSLEVIDSSGNKFGNYPLVFSGRILGLAVGDINQDSYPDIVFFFSRIRNNVAKLVILSGYDGQILLEKDIANEGEFVSAPILVDIDNDNDLEIIAAIKFFGSESGYLHVFNADGTAYSGWPKLMKTYGLTTGEPSLPSAGDIDGDGDLEIFFVEGH